MAQNLERRRRSDAVARALDAQGKTTELTLFRIWTAGAQSNIGASYIPNQVGN